MTNILAIDPSSRNIGFAILQISSEDKMIKKLYQHTYYADKEDDITIICDKARRQIQRKLDATGAVLPLQIVLEKPTFMTGDKGLIAAQRGYTIDLALVVGYLMACFSVGSLDIHLYTPMQWKGTKPKSATQAAFMRMFPHLKIESEHSCDATMLGVYHCKQTRLIR